MDILLIVLLSVIIVGILGVAVLVYTRLGRSHDDASAVMMKADITELSRTITQLQESVGNKLEHNNMTMQTSVQRQLSQSTRLITDVTQRLAKLDETNRRVVDVADELKTLQNVLQNPKQRGVFGEFYLQSVLENVLPPGQFKLQYKFENGDIVDAVIMLEKGHMLSVDSKFSLENYNRMIEASDKAERDQLLLKVKNDLKNRIDETSKYIRPSEKTMDFAFMFIPSESLYYDLLISNVGTGGSSRDLIEYAFRDKRVIIVSPTSFMAYLQTVLQGLRSLQIEEQAKDIQIRVGKLGQHMAVFEGFMQKLGNTLGTTVNHYNAAHKELGKVDKDIVKIAQSTPSVEPLTLDRPRQDDID